jgi:hypothetical protein
MGEMLVDAATSVEDDAAEPHALWRDVPDDALD